MSIGRRLTTDTGTAVLHLVIVSSFLFLLLTGFRIAADTPSTTWLMALDPMLPMEHVWLRHVTAAAVLVGAFLAYAAYIRTARLGSRIALDGARVRGLLRSGKPRRSALSVMMLWSMLLFVAVETVTGTLIMLGLGDSALTVHLHATWIGLMLAGLHILSHALIGGRNQLLRVFRPAPLVLQPPEPNFAELLAEQLRLRSSGPVGAGVTAREAPEMVAGSKPEATRRLHPGFAGLTAVGCFLVLAFALESATRSRLKIVRVDETAAPTLDGDLREPAWMQAAPVTIITTHGGDFGGTQQSAVEVRAIHDGTYAYFAFVWTDPTRSLKHMPLIKTAAGWEIATTQDHGTGESGYIEDQFSVLLARSTLPLIGAAIHLSAAPRSDRPPSGSGRGLHYTGKGVADVWLWQASHGGPNGHIENCHFGPAAEPTPEQVDGSVKYRGGFAIDPGQPKASRPNLGTGGTGATGIVPERLPRDIVRTMRMLGQISKSPLESDSENARWWMTEQESQPYNSTSDKQIPVGTVIPGIISVDSIPSSETSIRGVAKWAAGRWTLEIARKLHTTSEFDVPIETGTMLWVAAFDRSATRHTRHLRPVVLEIE